MNFSLKQIFQLLLLIIFAMVISSCGSDEDGDITGTYILTEVSSSGCDDTSDNVSFDLSDDGCQSFNGEEVCISGSMTLTESTFASSLVISSQGDSETINQSGTYTIEGSIITICDSDGCQASSYNLSNSELTIRFPEDDFDSCAITYKGKK